MNFHDYMREYYRVGGALEGLRADELIRRIGQSGPAGRPPCRVCGDDFCGKVSCLRAILADEERLAFRQRLAWHAAAAKRDAATGQNGHGRR